MKEDIETLVLDENDNTKNSDDDIEIIDVEDKTDEKPENNFTKGPIKPQKSDVKLKILMTLFIVSIILLMIFLIVLPLVSRWSDRRKRKEAIYDSKYKVLVCKKVSKPTDSYSETDAVKVYYSNSKVKKVDYIKEDNFFDKDDEYTKLVESCTALDNKKGNIVGYSKKCLIAERKITINEEYNLELFNNDSKTNEKIKSVVTFDQNIDSVKKYYTTNNYNCE